MWNEVSEHISCYVGDESPKSREPAERVRAAGGALLPAHVASSVVLSWAGTSTSAAWTATEISEYREGRMYVSPVCSDDCWVEV